MNNFCPYDGAMPMVVAPASAPPPGRERQERRGGGGGGFFDRDRFREGGEERDWSRREEQPSGGNHGRSARVQRAWR
jgi:hypothetical protein